MFKELIMSLEITSTTELSSEELDLVAGGAITEQQGASFLDKENALLSTFSVGPYGFTSGTKAINNTTRSVGTKFVNID
jgi:hypothetical protein